MKSLLTFVIPTKNRVGSLKKIINTLSEIKEINIIIVDDGSGIKNSLKIKKHLLKTPNVKYHHFKESYGQSYACNKGLKLTNTDYVWFFDDDDFVSKISIRDVLNLIKNRNIQGLLLPMKIIFNNFTLKIIYPGNKRHDFDNLRSKGQLVNTSCAVFKTSIIRDINGWDNSLFSGTDTDLFLRFSRVASFTCIKTNPVEVNFSNSDKVTFSFFRAQKGKIDLLFKHWKILTFKRRLYYFVSFFLFFPFFRIIKFKLISIISMFKNFNYKKI